MPRTIYAKEALKLLNRKTCPKCLMSKPLSEFKSRANGGPSGYCYKCSLGYFREYNVQRYASPEAREQELLRCQIRYKRVIRIGRMERKRKLVMMMGGKCVKCGYNKSSATLDFDHRDPKTKCRTISHLLAVNQSWGWKAAMKEARKCDLICSNCHREKTYPGQELYGPREIAF